MFHMERRYIYLTIMAMQGRCPTNVTLKVCDVCGRRGKQLFFNIIYNFQLLILNFGDRSCSY